MSINPQSLQILGMVLDRQQRTQEGAAARGHDISMANLDAEQRMMEMDLNIRHEERRDLRHQIAQWNDQLAQMGVKFDETEFGHDSQSNEMIERVGNSLQERTEALDGMISEKEGRLKTLRDAGAMITRGEEFGLGFVPEFDEDGMQIDNVFSTLSQSINRGEGLGFEEELMRLEGTDFLQDENISATERSAFIQGVRRTVQDRERFLTEQAHAREGLAFARQMQRDEAAIDLDEEARTMRRFEFLDQHKDKQVDIRRNAMVAPVGLASANISALSGSTERRDQSSLKEQREQIEAVLGAYGQDYGIGVSNWIFNNTDINQESSEGFGNAVALAYMQAGSNFTEMANVNHENARTEMEGALRTFKNAIEGEESIASAIANEKLQPETLGTVLAIVANPFTFAGFDSGFEFADIMMSSMVTEDAWKGVSMTGNLTRELERVRGADTDAVSQLKSFVRDAQLGAMNAGHVEDLERKKLQSDREGRLSGQIRGEMRTEIQEEYLSLTEGHNAYSEAMAEHSRLESLKRRRPSRIDEIEAEQERLQSIMDENETKYRIIKMQEPSVSRVSPGLGGGFQR